MDEIGSFGSWLKQRRRALDLTQAELARRVGCATSTVKKIEQDERRPSKEIAERLAEALELPLAERATFVAVARGDRGMDRLASPPVQPRAATAPLPTAKHAVLPTGTVTFLFTDLEHSTQLWEHHREAMPAVLARHDALLRAAIATHRGEVVKQTGDGMIAVFADAADAVAAAVAGQQALAQEAWSEVAVRARMALHSGAAEERDSDYYGPALNRAARLLAVGHGGQILLSRATAELVAERLPPGVALRELGQHQLKDLTRPEQIVQLVAPDLRTDFPPLTTSDSHPNNLPVQRDPLIGREREVAQVQQQLLRDDVGLVTLTGPGGIGKTRLALAVAAGLLPSFADGVFFVDLAPIRDPDLVATTIAQAVGVTAISATPLAAGLVEYLQDKHLLLVLDNFEQVLGAAPLVTNLLKVVPGLKALVTSRVVLHVSAEHEFLVPPLALPPPKEIVGAEVLLQYEAVILFIQRALQVKPDFQVDNANAPAIAQICIHLDGLPLAIVLAAARTKLFPPHALLRRLGRRLEMLRRVVHDLPPRQQTLRSTLDWSHDLLERGEQALFRRLGVFVGGCTLEAAQAVCNATNDLPLDVWNGLESLLDKSLLQRTDGPDGEPRVVMLETIREYAVERLEQSGEALTLQRRHAEYYLALVETMEPKLYGSDPGVWLDRLEVEHDNLRAALGWSWAIDDEGLTLRLAGMLWLFWGLHGHLQEGRVWLERARTRSSRVPPALRARALHGACRLALLQADYLQAEALGEESLKLYRALGDQRGVAATLVSLGQQAHMQGNYERAEVLFRESQDLYTTLGDRRGIIGLLHNHGIMAQVRGDYAKAAAIGEESLTLRRELGDKLLIASGLNRLGEVARGQGHYQEAAPLYIESLNLFRQLGDPWRVAMLLHNLGYVALHQAEVTRATALFSESMALRRKLDDRHGIALCLMGLASVAGARGQPKRAAQLFGAGAALLDSIGMHLEPADRAEYERNVVAPRSQLDNASFAASWAEGRAMTPEQATSYALEEDT